MHTWSGRILCAAVALAASGLAAACSAAPATAPAPSPAHQIAADEASVAGRYADCAAFTPAPHRCVFAVATVSDRSGGHLYGIELVQQTGDDCYRGIVYFYDGTRYVTSTRQLPPRSAGGVKTVRAGGAGEFSVVYWVNQNADTSCAGGGDGGTDAYTYRWTGADLVIKSGHRPRPPELILGTG